MSNITKPSTGGGGGGTLTSVVALNSTPQFVLSGTTETIDFGLEDLFIGTRPLGISGTGGNVGYGIAVAPSLTTGIRNTYIGAGAGQSAVGSFDSVAIGFNALNSSANDNSNVAIGSFALVACTSPENVAIGQASLGAITTLGSNTAIGNESLTNCTGGFNIGIGHEVGINYTGAETSNIIIGSGGLTGESHVLRIGDTGSGDKQVNECFIAGIVGNTIANASLVTIDLATGQLAIGPTATKVAFSVTLSTNQSNVTGNNTQYQVPYDTVEFDSASGYDSSTHLYTFPETGVYQLQTKTFLFGGTIASTQFFQWSSYNGGAYPGDRVADLNPGSLGLVANGEFLITSSWLHAATAGDTIGIFIDVLGGGSADVGVAGGTGADAQVNCAFSGFLT